MIHVRAFMVPGIAVGLLVLSAGPAFSQPTPGTYSYFWTNTAGAAITSTDVLFGQTVTIQLHIQETGGNAFASGIGGYDTTVTWGQSGSGQDLLFFAGAAPNTSENVNIRTNPYTTGGFNGPGAIRNDQVDAINIARTLNVNRSVQAVSDPSQWVNQTTPPNAGTTILLAELTFTATDNLGTTTVVGGQRAGQNTYLYFPGTGEPSTFLYLDPFIGTTTTPLTVNVVPVPEPASVLSLCATAAGAVGLVRRATRRRAVAAGS